MHRSVLHDGAEFRSNRGGRREASREKFAPRRRRLLPLPEGDDAEQHRETDRVSDRLHDTRSSPGSSRVHGRTDSSILHYVVLFRWNGRVRIPSLHTAEKAVALTQSKRYTGVPFATALGNHSADAIEMRTHPWEAGYAGTERAP